MFRHPYKVEILMPHEQSSAWQGEVEIYLARIDEILDWLSDQKLCPGFDYMVEKKIPFTERKDKPDAPNSVIFTFRTPDMATLFKLTWSGK